MNKTPITWTLTFPLPAQPLPFYYSKKSNEHLITRSLHSALSLTLCGRRRGAGQEHLTWSVSMLMVSYYRCYMSCIQTSVHCRWMNCQPCGCIVDIWEQQWEKWSLLVLLLLVIKKTTFSINLFARCCREDVAMCGHWTKKRTCLLCAIKKFLLYPTDMSVLPTMASTGL